MECVVSEYGWDKVPARVGVRAAGQVCAGDVCEVPPTARGHRSQGAAVSRPRPCTRPEPLPGPPMSEMDEVSYWVHTKRAPCLMNYDNVIKRQYEAAQHSTAQCSSDKSNSEMVPSPKKKKRKLSLLDGECMSDKQINVYFEASQQNDRTVPSSCKSGTLESDINFNIKESSNQGKRKRLKANNSGRTLHKKNKVVTSTPLRRSLRRAKNNLNISMESYDSINANGMAVQGNTNLEINSCQQNSKSLSRAAERNIRLEKHVSEIPICSKAELNPNGQFEDLSDVSGFTANYIRSTKLRGPKSKAMLRNKKCHLVKESQAAPSKQKLVMCVNKSVNATEQQPHASILNCSTDSSQNVLNLVTMHTTNQPQKVNKSTSALKFVDMKPSKQNTLRFDSSKESSKTDLNFSCQPKNDTNSRYPRRHKYQSPEDVSIEVSQMTLDKRKRVNKTSESKCVQKQLSVSRTRNSRNKSLMQKAASPVMVYSIPTEETTPVELNVASEAPEAPRRTKSKRLSSSRFPSKLKTSMEQIDSVMNKESVREQSGFAACFSDSDEGGEALKQRKFFC